MRKPSKCKGCKIKIPDVSRADSFHISCEGLNIILENHYKPFISSVKFDLYEEIVKYLDKGK